MKSLVASRISSSHLTELFSLDLELSKRVIRLTIKTIFQQPKLLVCDSSKKLNASDFKPLLDTMTRDQIGRQ
jgi:hypothetical protein